ncbi:MAG: ATP-binding protein, partial [Desulfobacterales bacterium]|nr:ATP-binding protein [Desulfobacterales bacterium]
MRRFNAMNIHPDAPPQKLTGKTLLFLVIILIAVVCAIFFWSRADGLSGLRSIAGERLVLYKGTLNSALEKYRYLPYFLSRDETVIQLLAGRSTEGPVNTLLETANNKAGSAEIFVMDKSGNTVCASNWNAPTTFVGQNYGFRPYFKDAMAGDEGGFYAIGATTGTPGYFMSHPVYDFQSSPDAPPIGVVVVKVDLSGLERHWMEGGEIVFVSDANGVIFLSGNPNWKYKSLLSLSPKILKDIRQGKQYKGINLTPLPLERGTAGQDNWIRINKKKFFLGSLFLESFDWQLNYLIPWERLEKQVNFALYISSAAGVLLILSILFAQERRLKKRSQQQALEAEKIGRINRKLKREVEERRRTETHLRQTQEELVQSAKLAALGQMAAAIVHELNQPISAIRTYAASCRLMAGQGKTEDLTTTLLSISDITKSMEGITRQLKDFSRKSPLDIRPVAAEEPVARAVDLMRYAIDAADCRLSIEAPEAPLSVMGDRLRLEQVFVNLIKNSLDAMAEQENKLISVRFREEDDMVSIHFRDSGPGINPDLRENIFTPFFTTKAKGDGLGLGLSISAGIVKEISGQI